MILTKEQIAKMSSTELIANLVQAHAAAGFFQERMDLKNAKEMRERYLILRSEILNRLELNKEEHII